MRKSRPTRSLHAATQLKERLADLRGPARLDPSIVHREVYAAHQDMLHLIELLHAEQHARSQGCDGPVYRVEDRWGGYWQTKSDWGPYNFTLGSAKR